MIVDLFVETVLGDLHYLENPVRLLGLMFVSRHL